MFPSDHVIADEKSYRATIERGVEIAAAGENIVVLGIRPNRAETGYGYIEAGGAFESDALRVRRFTEKPDAEKAAAFVAAGNYFWNSGMFLWSARTLANALREHLPRTAPLLEEIAAAFGTRKICGDFQEAISEVRKHQRRLRRAGTAVGKGRAGRKHRLPSCGFRLERPGFVDRSARASHREDQSDCGEHHPQCGRIRSERYG